MPRSSQYDNHVERYQARQPAPVSAKATRGNGGALPLSRGRSSRAASAGLSVSELNAEMSVETAMVRANWRKNWPGDAA